MVTRPGALPGVGGRSQATVREALDLRTLGRGHLSLEICKDTNGGRRGGDGVPCPHSLCSHSCLRPFLMELSLRRPRPLPERPPRPCLLFTPLCPCSLPPTPAHATSRMHMHHLLHSGCWSPRHLATCHRCEGRGDLLAGSPTPPCDNCVCTC